MEKMCKTCKITKSLNAFPKHPECLDGHKGVCKVCTYEQQKNRTKLNGNLACKTYSKTVKGYLVRTYVNMRGRITGLLKKKAHLYEGKELLNKESFYEWSLSSPDFKRLLQEYEASGYDLKLAPSIDRIDSTGGYTLDNIRWVTHSENSRLGAISRNSGMQPKEKCIMPVGGPV